MKVEPVYVLDADVFMTAARSYYAFDLVPAFWDVLVRQASQGRLLSIDRVRDEIAEGKDQLREWANNRFRRWFCSTRRRDVLEAYRSIMAWAYEQSQFTDPAKAEFAHEKNADAWVVAYAKAGTNTVVTNEKYDGNIRRRIKIPNVCRAFGVPYVDLFQMLRALGVQLS